VPRRTPPPPPTAEQLDRWATVVRMAAAGPIDVDTLEDLNDIGRELYEAWRDALVREMVEEEIADRKAERAYFRERSAR
jgi:hypothetical protein